MEIAPLVDIVVKSKTDVVLFNKDEKPITAPFGHSLTFTISSIPLNWSCLRYLEIKHCNKLKAVLDGNKDGGSTYC